MRWGERERQRGENMCVLLQTTATVWSKVVSSLFLLMYCSSNVHRTHTFKQRLGLFRRKHTRVEDKPCSHNKMPTFGEFNFVSLPTGDAIRSWFFKVSIFQMGIFQIQSILCTNLWRLDTASFILAFTRVFAQILITSAQNVNCDIVKQWFVLGTAFVLGIFKSSNQIFPKFFPLFVFCVLY